MSKKKDTVHIKVDIIKKAPKDKEFHLLNGKRVADLRSLAHELGEMSDDLFFHHVSDLHNDFANWSKDVFKEKELSELLKKSRNRVQTQVTILKHLVDKL